MTPLRVQQKPNAKLVIKILGDDPAGQMRPSNEQDRTVKYLDTELIFSKPLWLFRVGGFQENIQTDS